MGDPVKIDVAIVARDLKLPPEKIDATVELLDQGNTISFITRFRKDLTGGLDEKQILAIKNRVAQLRSLGERKEFVLKSIDSQSKLTDELKTEISKASTSRRLEDLYLPFKPKKQSRALVARQQGLEPLADDIFNGISPDVDLATRATEFVRVDKGLKTVDEVFKGVRDLLAERFGDKEELRGTLRKILWDQGKLTTQVIATETAAEESEKPSSENSSAPSAEQKKESLPKKAGGEADQVESAQPAPDEATQAPESGAQPEPTAAETSEPKPDSPSTEAVADSKVADSKSESADQDKQAPAVETSEPAATAVDGQADQAADNSVAPSATVNDQTPSESSESKPASPAACLLYTSPSPRDRG